MGCNIDYVFLPNLWQNVKFSALNSVEYGKYLLCSLSLGTFIANSKVINNVVSSVYMIKSNGSPDCVISFI